METITAADIRDITDGRIQRDEARDIARTAMQIAKSRHVSVWELSNEQGQIFLDGWDCKGFEACHELLCMI
ncbi:MAG: hypothetical protein WBG19_00245 [Thermoplasmata archaeon]